MKEQNSRNAATKFVELLRNGQIRKSILPNTALSYSNCQEAKDLRNYKKFLQSFAYDDLKNTEVRIYDGD